MNPTTLGPALPWAVPDPAQSPAVAAGDATDEEMEEPCGLHCEAVGIKVGDSVEVKWHVNPEEGDAYDLWWKATVREAPPGLFEPVEADAAAGAEAAGAASEAATTSTTTPGRARTPRAQQTPGKHEDDHIYELLYDPREGFEAETAICKFVHEHVLYDVAEGQELVWRRFGDEWEESEGEEDEIATGEAVIAEVHKRAREDGEVLLERSQHDALVRVGMACMVQKLSGHLDAAGQRFMADGARMFAEGLDEFIARKAEEREDKSQPFTVTKSVIDEYMQVANEKYAAFKKQRLGA